MWQALIADWLKHAVLPIVYALVAVAVWLIGSAIASALMVIVIGVLVQFSVTVAAGSLLAQGLPADERVAGEEFWPPDADAGPVSE